MNLHFETLKLQFFTDFVLLRNPVTMAMMDGYIRPMSNVVLSLPVSAYVYYGLLAIGLFYSRLYRFEFRLYLHQRYRDPVNKMTLSWEVYRLLIHYYVYLLEEPLQHWIRLAMKHSFLLLGSWSFISVVFLSIK